MPNSRSWSSKQSLRAEQLLDPFEIESDWFEIQLPSMQLVCTTKLPEHLRQRAQNMLERLHLQNDERVLSQRREWYRMYREDGLSLEGLAKKAPLIAVAEGKRLAEYEHDELT